MREGGVREENRASLLVNEHPAESEVWKSYRKRVGTLMGRLRQFVAGFQRELAVWRRVLADPRTPRAAKWLLGLAVVYAVTPVDIIPDFVPILGHLDDLVVLPLLVWLAIKLTPPEVIADARTVVAQGVVTAAPA